MVRVRPSCFRILLAAALISPSLGVWLLTPSRAIAQEAVADDGSGQYSSLELVDRLAEQLSTIESLYCEYQIEFLGKDESAPTTVSKRRFARAGKKWFLANQIDEGSGESRTLYDGDTVFGYRVLLLPAGEQLENTTVQMDAEQEFPLLTPDAFLGTDLSNLRRSVVNVLRLADIELSHEKADGETILYRLVARDVGSNGRDQNMDETRAKTRYRVDTLLDPTHGFLPRELLITQDAETTTWPDWKQHVKVLEYRDVVDERTNKVRWFPFTAVLEQGRPAAPDIKFTVSKLQINPELSKSLFELRIPDGTQWMDARIHGPGSKIPKKGEQR